MRSTQEPRAGACHRVGLVSDWDGGTRIGDALQAFLAVPRFAGYARGAVVLILSDGLERGDPKAMTDAVKRLAARAWHLSWMTPLAADPGYRPETAALKSILPHDRRAGRRQLHRPALRNMCSALSQAEGGMRNAERTHF